MGDKELLTEQYYHGRFKVFSRLLAFFQFSSLLSREDIKAMLRSNSDFIVRSTEPMVGQLRAYVLSVTVQQELEDQGVSGFPRLILGNFDVISTF